MKNFNLITITVPHGKADMISETAVKAGSFGGTVCTGRGISANSVKAALGLGESTLDLIFIITEDSQTKTICDAIIDSTKNERPNFGSLYTIKVGHMMKTQIIQGEKAKMSKDTENELITIILNRGYADDAMAAARKAGALGGTVINARGTAREDDAKFFGMHIVPEKEMLMIVVDSTKKDSVLEAIRTLPCLSDPGSGIAFCSAVDDFSLLGKK